MNVHVSERIPWRDGAREEGWRRGGEPLICVAHTSLTLTLPPTSRALFIAPFTCLTLLLHCTTPRALNLP